jgi:putative transposase
MKRYASRFPVEMMSRALGVSKGGYYKSLKINSLKGEERALDNRIKGEFEKSRRTYGSPRLTVRLNEGSAVDKVSESTVARRMKALKLVARQKPKFVHTTDSGHQQKASPNLLSRQFEVEQVNKVWVSDITYIPTDKGWRYLTVILDLGDRAVVGWAVSETLHAQYTVIRAFEQAVAKRGIHPQSGLMFHSDRGIQYACDEFRAVLAQYRVVQSMSAKGNCWDNAVAESFFKTIKTEELYQYKIIPADGLKSLLFKYIEGWYNTQRIHSALKGKTPWQTFYQKSLTLAA